MAFGSEVKDFLGAFKGVHEAQESASREKYYDSLADKKGKADTSDPDGAMNGVDIDGDGGDAKVDSTAPHGMLYNLGKWLGLSGDDKGAAKPAAIGASPVAANEMAGAVPLDAYSASVSPTDNTDGYSRGGLVRAFSEGGQVPEDDSDQGDDPPAAPAAAAAIPVDDEPAPPAEESDDAAPEAAPAPEAEASAVPTDDAPQQPAAAPSDDAGAPDVGDQHTLSQALHGGIMALTSNFNLDHRAQAVTDPQQMAMNQKAVMSGVGRPTAAVMQQLAKSVDPKGELTHSQMVLRAMTKAYEHYMAKGDPARANNFAAEIIQYSTFEASKHGEDALTKLQKGDIAGAAKSLQAGYANIPDGREATNIKINADKSVNVTETDVTTGKPIEEHTLSPQQLYQAAIGLANKTQSWQAIMTAAGRAKGATPQPSAAYTQAMAALQGGKPSGAAAPVTQQGNQPAQAIPVSGGQAAPDYQPDQGAAPAQAQPDQAQPDQGQQNGALIAGADPEAMHAVESNNNPGAVSPKGAVGVGQTMPATLTDPGFGIAPARDNSPQEQQRVADEYLGAMVKQYGPVDGHIAYNWGPGHMIAWKQSGGDFRRLPQETQQYLGRIAVAQQHPQQGAAPQQGAIPHGAGHTVPTQQPQQAAALDLQASLPDDRLERPSFQAPKREDVGALKRVEPDQKMMAQMTPTERSNYLRTISTMNASTEAEYKAKAGDADKRYQDDNRTAQAAYRDDVNYTRQTRDQAAAPVKMSPQDSASLTAYIKASLDDVAKDTTSPYAAFSPATQKAVPNVAFGVKALNQDLDTGDAVNYATRLLDAKIEVDPKNPKNVSITAPWTAYASEKNPNAVRVVFKTGDSILLPKNAYVHVRQQLMNDANAKMQGAVPKPPGAAARFAKDIPKAGRAVGKIASNISDSVGQALKIDEKRPLHTVTDTAKGVLDAVRKGVSGADAPFLDKQNR